MPKNKGIYKIFRTKEEYERELHFQRIGARLFQLDYDMLALGRMGFGPVNYERFDAQLTEVMNDYEQEMRTDIKDDRELVYSRDLIERELKQHQGSFYRPPEERHSIDVK